MNESVIYELGKINSEDIIKTGRKAFNLDQLIKKEIDVPQGIVLTSDLYEEFLDSSRLGSWLSITVEKKALSEMRLEEVWDLSHRINHKFIMTPIPEQIQSLLIKALSSFSHKALVVRSSSPAEDSGKHSFAGLHDSIVNVRGIVPVLDAIKAVWSSLWSDRALAYLKENSLSLNERSMAVIIQEFIPGDCSGVFFTRHFKDKNQAVIEMVPGLNEGLVSGSVEPDRFVIDRESGEIQRRHQGERTKIVEAYQQGIRFIKLSDQEKSLSFGEKSIEEIFKLGKSLELEYGEPQDIEWTISKDRVVLLQSRPITAGAQRVNKSFDELMDLKQQIEDEFMPQLHLMANEFSLLNIEELDVAALENEVEKRRVTLEKWEQIYVDSFIPLAHGVRLFGDMYSRIIQADSPFEFIELLVHDDFKSLKRNQALEHMALLLKKRERGALNREIELFLEEYGQSSFFNERLFKDRDRLIAFLEHYSEDYSLTKKSENKDKKKLLERSFLNAMIALGKENGEELLDLARVSYRLRDDDNLAVGRIRGEYLRARDELNKRQKGSDESNWRKSEKSESFFKVKKRHVTGTGASQGIATGLARVIETPDDLFQIRKGEILVCDSIDPNITFIIPLAAGIVERRGGMLVHGAIIAREYGIPCITGVANATEIIATGDVITVDAYNGIVTISN